MNALPPDCVIITCAARDRDEAEAIAAELVEQRLAACVQLGAIDSVFRWEGDVHREAEVGLTIHTTAARAAEAIASIERLHSYDVPGISMIPLAGGSPAYLHWIWESVEPE